jgi:hypothetical protein
MLQREMKRAVYAQSDLPVGFFSSISPTDISYDLFISPVRTTCLAYPILLDLFIHINYGSSTLCNFLQSTGAFVSFLLGS